MKKAYMICIYNEEIIYMLNEVKCLYFPRKVENGIVGIHCLWLKKNIFDNSRFFNLPCYK